MTVFFTRRRNIPGCLSMNQTEPSGKIYSNGKLRTLTLVNGGALRSTANFLSA